MLVPVLLSGGVGSRLWPLSRELSPKQFLPLTGELSLLEETLQRAQQLGRHSLHLRVQLQRTTHCGCTCQQQGSARVAQKGQEFFGLL